MRFSDSFEADATPNAVVARWRIDDEGEHVVRVAVELSDASKTTVEGPPLMLVIDEGVISRVTPLTAHGVAAQVRGPAVISIERDTTVALLPASGTWLGKLDVRPGRVATEITKASFQLDATTMSGRTGLPFGATGLFHKASVSSERVFFYAPSQQTTAAELYAKSANASSAGYDAPYVVPRAADAYRMYNADAAAQNVAVYIEAIV